jgi:hypothetical protein
MFHCSHLLIQHVTVTKSVKYITIHIARSFSYTVDLEYITFETKSIVSWQTYCQLLDTEQQLNPCDHKKRYQQILNVVFGPLLRLPFYSWKLNMCSFILAYEMHKLQKYNQNISSNFQEKKSILCFGYHFNGSYFWSCNVHIEQAQTYVG